MYRQLNVWKKSYSLALEVYKSTRSFPKDELFGLTSQMRRSATSIPANIAEGNTRESKKEYRHFVAIARGSAAELETWIMFSKDLGYISIEQSKKLSKAVDEVKALLFGLSKSLR